MDLDAYEVMIKEMEDTDSDVSACNLQNEYGAFQVRKNNFEHERTFLYGEEDILAEKMLKKGYIAYYDPEVCVKHNESSSMKEIPKGDY